MFDLRNRTHWQFDDFITLLAQTIMLYLVAGLVFPDFPEGKTVDLREHYFAIRRRFYALLTALASVSIARDVVLNHSLPDKPNLLFHIFYIAMGIAGIAVAREWFHKVLTVVIGSVVVLYIGLLFTQLR